MDNLYTVFEIFLPCTFSSLATTAVLKATTHDQGMVHMGHMQNKCQICLLQLYISDNITN